MKIYSAFEAKTKLSQILREVEAGEQICITRHGKRIAIVSSAVSAPVRRKPGVLRDQISMAKDFDAPLADFQEYS